ncbi:hypothetical protein ACPV4S_24275 [Vibrio alginolyticus]|uniref:hypothetical protein n=1 Tax=Vibrio alginolyticus TaxID=663 RepID=UPI004068462B
MLLVGGSVSVALLQTPFIEWLCSKLFDYVLDQNSTSGFWPPFSFYLLLFSGLSLGFYTHKLDKSKGANLVDNVTRSGSFKIKNSDVCCFLGSVENISDIDVVVTSENTNLDLGSISGTSVSGRIRKMAASFDEKNTLVRDNLNDFITAWKKEHGLGPFTKGRCIISPPFNAEQHGIKSIVHAIAIEKNAGKPANIDFSAIKTIVKYSINHTLNSNYNSVFIPVFGLGSGQVEQEDAINYTVDAIKASLENTDKNITIYIGVYKTDDSFALIKQLTRKTL